MTDRGSYRSIHTVIVDGPDFQALKPGAKLVWYTLKLTLGPSGIDVVPSLVGTLMERTGADVKQVERGLAQLIEAGWVQVERNVVWMVDGLKHDPHIRLDNQNHRIKIAKHANGLPSLAIVEAFRAYYGLAKPPAKMPSAPHVGASERGTEMPSDMASKSPSMMGSTDHHRSGKGKREREKGKGEGNGREKYPAAGATGDEEQPNARSRRTGQPTWLTPFADAWRARYGGTMAAGKAVKALSRLVEEEGEAEVLRRWNIYLAETAAEYANAPKFAETWGRWAAALVRTAPSVGTGGDLSARDEARVEAGQLVAQVRALVYDQQIPGQGFKRLLRRVDVEGLGADVAAAVETCGGIPRILKLETDASDIAFYIRDFAAALAVARRPLASEAASA